VDSRPHTERSSAKCSRALCVGLTANPPEKLKMHIVVCSHWGNGEAPGPKSLPQPTLDLKSYACTDRLIGEQKRIEQKTPS